jgi:hypothetical protein
MQTVHGVWCDCWQDIVAPSDCICCTSETQPRCHARWQPRKFKVLIDTKDGNND